MKTYIALLRGINVGGSHSLQMKELTLLLERAGCVELFCQPPAQADKRAQLRKNSGGLRSMPWPTN